MKRTTFTNRRVVRQRNKRDYQWLELAAFVLLLALLAAAGSIFNDVTIGQVCIGLYGVIALFRKAASATAFKMALTTLIFIPFITFLQGDSQLADTFAVYAYLLLVVGTVLAVAELWRANHGKHRYVDDVRKSARHANHT